MKFLNRCPTNYNSCRWNWFGNDCAWDGLKTKRRRTRLDLRNSRFFEFQRRKLDFLWKTCLLQRESNVWCHSPHTLHFVVHRLQRAEWFRKRQMKFISVWKQIPLTFIVVLHWNGRHIIQEWASSQRVHEFELDVLTDQWSVIMMLIPTMLLRKRLCPTWFFSSWLMRWSQPKFVRKRTACSSSLFNKRFEFTTCSKRTFRMKINVVVELAL